VGDILENVYSNCGGGFMPRPIRPEEALLKYPPTTQQFNRPVDMTQLSEMQEKYEEIEPEDR